MPNSGAQANDGVREVRTSCHTMPFRRQRSKATQVVVAAYALSIDAGPRLTSKVRQNPGHQGRTPGLSMKQLDQIEGCVTHKRSNHQAQIRSEADDAKQ